MSKLFKLIKEAAEWPYYYLKNGILVYEKGYKAFNNAPKFKNVDEAEKWLEKEDERGNVVGDYKDKVQNSKK